MSDSRTTATAHAFIRELEEREAEKSRMEQDCEGPEDFVFKKPIFHHKNKVYFICFGLAVPGDRRAPPALRDLARKNPKCVRICSVAIGHAFPRANISAVFAQKRVASACAVKECSSELDSVYTADHRLATTRACAPALNNTVINHYHRDMTSFSDRQKSLFNHLKDAEDQYSFSKYNKVETPHDNGVMDRKHYRKLKHEMKQFRGKESIFKRPESTIRDCLRTRSAPDYMKNPQRYKYYSLSDVTQEQMSDSTNTATAHAFIRELEEREAEKSRMEQDCEGPEDFVFKKPIFHVSATVKKTPELESPKAVFKSSKVLMPEYVVGRTQHKDTRIVRRDLAKGDVEGEPKATLKLNHLYEDNDDEEE
ncbi:hypothetical protein MSG28_005089 [Choristoneura fumiferana]|nr:hypothetical protein MSG28_005089 [Choristoneura fumiferana]